MIDIKMYRARRKEEKMDRPAEEVAALTGRGTEELHEGLDRLEPTTPWRDFRAATLFDGQVSQ